jgi:hypothetical protein
MKFAVTPDSKLETKKQKGVFPYEFLNTNNYIEELSKQDLFKYEDFNSFLKQKIFLKKNIIILKNYQKICLVLNIWNGTTNKT